MLLDLREIAESLDEGQLSTGISLSQLYDATRSTGAGFAGASASNTKPITANTPTPISSPRATMPHIP